MKYEKKQEKNKIIYNVVVEAKEFDEFFKKALEKISKEVEVDGFRKGHVPAHIAETHVDSSIVLSHATEDCISNKWFEIVNKEKIEAIAQPNVEILKMAQGNPLEFKAEVEVLPEIKLPDYKKIASSVKGKEIKIEKKEYKDAINWLCQSRAKFSQKDGKAENGDFIEITYSAKALDEGKEKKDRFILGKGHYIKGLEEKLIGSKRGEEKEVKITNPEDEKKKVALNVKVESVQKMEVPELNEAFAKVVGFESLAKLKTGVKDGMKKEKETAEKQRKRTEVLEKIAKETKLEVPQVLIERETDTLVQNLKNRTSQELQMSFEDYLNQVKKTEEDIRKEFASIANERVKGFLILHEIEKKEKVVIEEKELNKKIEELAAQYPNKDQAKEEMKNSNARFYIEDELKRDKIFNILGC